MGDIDWVFSTLKKMLIFINTEAGSGQILLKICTMHSDWNLIK